jgi:hypothetical protein
MTTVDFATQRYFDEVSVGDEFEQWQEPTSEHVRAFMSSGRNTGRRGPNDPGSGRFDDMAEARRQGLERPIVPGNMSASMLTRLVTDWMGPLGRVVSLDVSFRRPLLHNDRVRCVAVVTDASHDALEAGGPGLVSLDLTMENERGEKPVQGTALVELPRRM